MVERVRRRLTVLRRGLMKFRRCLFVASALTTLSLGAAGIEASAQCHIMFSVSPNHASNAGRDPQFAKVRQRLDVRTEQAQDRIVNVLSELSSGLEQLVLEHSVAINADLSANSEQGGAVYRQALGLYMAALNQLDRVEESGPLKGSARARSTKGQLFLFESRDRDEGVLSTLKNRLQKKTEIIRALSQQLKRSSIAQAVTFVDLARRKNAELLLSGLISNFLFENRLAGRGHGSESADYFRVEEGGAFVRFVHVNLQDKGKEEVEEKIARAAEDFKKVFPRGLTNESLKLYILVVFSGRLVQVRGPFLHN